MNERLVEAIVILENAYKIRETNRAKPDPEIGNDTEESVITALLISGVPNIEVLRLKKRYTRALRLLGLGAELTLTDTY